VVENPKSIVLTRAEKDPSHWADGRIYLGIKAVFGSPK
jgi:hypothetical protein